MFRGYKANSLAAKIRMGNQRCFVHAVEYRGGWVRDRVDEDSGLATRTGHMWTHISYTGMVFSTLRLSLKLLSVPWPFGEQEASLSSIQTLNDST